MKMTRKALLFAVICIFATTLRSQTPGTLQFSVTTTEPSGGYSGAHVFALWIETDGGSFVKTKMRYAASRIQYLNVWISQSGYDVTDAITGPTLNTHGTKTISWNATAVNGSLVPDGTYKIWMQMSDKNMNGPTYSVSFVKGPAAISNQTFADHGNLTSMTLSWTPSSSSVSVDKEATVSVLQNHDARQILFSPSADGSIRIYAANGSLLARSPELCTGQQWSWNHSGLPSGIYFYTAKTKTGCLSGKLILTR
jgi:hypothetical protein